MARGDSRRGESSNHSQNTDRGFTRLDRPGVSTAPNGPGKPPTLITRDKAARDWLRAELDAIDAEEPDD